MKKILPFLDRDVQNSSPQYLEDLATGYWFSEVLFAAVEMDIFSRLEPEGSTIEDLAEVLDIDPGGLYRFLGALSASGLITRHCDRYFNARISHDYLVRGKEDYQGDSILWRKYLQPYWKGLADCLRTGGRVDYEQQSDSAERTDRIRKYIRAMDCIARTKAKEILTFFKNVPIKGELLDVGAGSGAIAASFLKQYPEMTATLIDLPEILEYTKELIRGRGFGSEIQYCSANILEQWPLTRRGFDLVILSNILHAYSEKELPHILTMAAGALNQNGILLIHDFFSEHCPEKAALSDLNMFINTFNGKVFCSSLVREALHRLGFSSTALIPLETDTAVLFASRNATVISSLHIDPVSSLLSKIRALGFRKVYRLKSEDIVVANWTDLKCRFGCDRHGSPNCPPNSISSEKTRSIMEDYRYAILLEGEPPTRDFQMRVLRAEREAFLSGFPKAFSFWAGPCSLCHPCASDGKCRNTANARPSMEGAGIDVFETVKRTGSKLRPLKGRTDFAKYYGLILLE